MENLIFPHKENANSKKKKAERHQRHHQTSSNADINGPEWEYYS